MWAWSTLCSPGRPAWQSDLEASCPPPASPQESSPDASASQNADTPGGPNAHFLCFASLGSRPADSALDGQRPLGLHSVQEPRSWTSGVPQILKSQRPRHPTGAPMVWLCSFGTGRATIFFVVVVFATSFGSRTMSSLHSLFHYGFRK